MSYAEQYDPAEGIAIVGMAGRFPGARSVGELWQLLLDGRETISRFTPDELEPSFREDMRDRGEPGYVAARGILDDIDRFDEGFFGFSPAEAALLDPQQRLFLQTAWEALEDAAHDPAAFRGLIGVFAGGTANSYYLQNLLGRPDVTDRLGLLTTQMANQGHYIATRTAYKLDLRGPALNIHTACSTSLVAVCTAVQSLQAFQCDLALAGGVSVTLPQRRGYRHQAGSILSPDGHCRSFDADAGGTVFSNGLGIVALRRLQDALDDGDSIYAVIKGAALNNDGQGKLSFTAPSIDGQAEVIAMAQALGGIDPQTIQYVEAHGTGTALGDPIEVAALTQAFRSGGARGQGFCALGSLKSHIGHLDAAAGVAGLIKTALALHHRVLPGQLHYRAAHPQLQLADSPFFVNDSTRDWPRGATPRRAGVSSFGVGGTNAHVVLEEAPEAARAPDGDPSEATGRPQLLLLSGRDEAAVERAADRLMAHLQRPATAPLADIARTLHEGRRAFGWRRAVVARDAASAAARLAGERDPPRRARTESGVAFLFPGQGSQQVNRGRGLYRDEPAFRREVDACAAVLRAPLGLDIRDLLFPEPGQEVAAQRQLTQTALTQPALVTLEIALARLWMSWGVQPTHLIGHSLGELAAACIGGTFERDDVLMLVVQRGRLMQAQPPGAMLAVRASPAELQGEISEAVSLAAVNAPRLSVLSGPVEAMARVAARLDARGIAHRAVETSHAFHSAMMDPVVEAFESLVGRTRRHAPRLPWHSSLTGRLITAQEALSPAYWARQLREAVRFSDGLQAVLPAVGACLEVGPGDGLVRLARQHEAGRGDGPVLLASLPSGAGPQRSDAELEQVLETAGALWCAGVTLDPRTLHPQGRRRGGLPTYPFAPNRHWVDPAPAAEPAAAPQDLAPMPSMPPMPEPPAAVMTPDRLTPLCSRLAAEFADLAGIEPGALDVRANFLELGLDSLLLTQAATRVQKVFGVAVPMRLLLEDCTSVDALARHLLPQLPADAPAPVPGPLPGRVAPPMVLPSAVVPGALDAAAASGGWAEVFARQLAVMGQQLEMMRAAGVLPAGVAPTGDVGAGAPAVGAASPVPATRLPADPVAPPAVAVAEAAPPAATAAPAVPAFGPYRPPSRTAGPLTEAQRVALRFFVAAYNARTAGSKQATQEHRAHLADPRSVAGYRQHWKELTYPLVTVRSSGSALWDVDGHRYVDITNGFGMILFGHNPPFIREAVAAQLDAGYEIGPQTPLAGEVARALCRMVGLERAAFCSTGSEAVMAAIRMARTVTGRDTIVIFQGAYHGIFDEVLVRPGRTAADGTPTAALPVAPGIPAAMARHVVVLEYGAPASLKAVQALGPQLAAVLVEPVQSRRPELQPREFLHELRAITERCGAALVFDEVVTGFRVHPGGAQALFGVRADIACYGKVVGGGLPIGVVAGSARFMDALDGGAWRFGDDSAPEAGMTFFAGTFVRHPLALAAARAVLARLEAEGPELQRGLNLRTTRFVETLREVARDCGAPLEIAHFSSWFCFQWSAEHLLASLFFPAMRLRGIHVWEGRPCFLTLAHTDEDLQQVAQAVRESIGELQAAGFLPPAPQTDRPPERESAAAAAVAVTTLAAEAPPVPGARRGRDREGRDAWFVADPERPGKYLQILDRPVVQHG